MEQVEGHEEYLDAGRKNAKAPIVVRVEDGISISCLMEGLEIMLMDMARTKER